MNLKKKCLIVGLLDKIKFNSYNTDMKDKALEKEIEELKKSLKKQQESKFSCVECRNQHMQILNWLTELSDYECGQIGKNVDNPNTTGYMSLDDAISHTEDVISKTKNNSVKDKHKQLLSWLQSLKKYRTKNTTQN